MSVNIGFNYPSKELVEKTTFIYLSETHSNDSVEIEEIARIKSNYLFYDTNDSSAISMGVLSPTFNASHLAFTHVRTLTAKKLAALTLPA